MPSKVQREISKRECDKSIDNVAQKKAHALLNNGGAAKADAMALRGTEVTCR